MEERITRFADEYHFLSNFYPVAIDFEAMTYPTIEHAFQAAKTFDVVLRVRIRDAKTPASAKSMGRRLKRRADWFDVSLEIMEALVRQKFTRYTDLSTKLLATGSMELIEGNTWNDKFYGCVWNTKQQIWIGENHLGRILMKIRSELE